MRWSLVLWVVASSCVGKVAHEAELDFGDVAPRSESRREFVVRNEGGAPIELISSVDSEFFSVDEESVTIPAGQSATLHLKFVSADPGAIKGLLRLHTTESYAGVVLRARTVGPLLLRRDTNELDFGDVPLLTDGKTDVVGQALTLENIGNEAVLLEVSVDSDEVCVGHWVERSCVPWVPTSLAPSETVRVPLELRALRAGERRWLVRISAGSVSLVDVFANVVEYEPCQLQFSGPELSVTGSIPLTVTHVGSKACRIDAFRSLLGDAISFSPATSLPLTLQPNVPWTLTMTLAANVEGLALVGTQFFSYEGAGFFVNRYIGRTLADCLGVGPLDVDFGDVSTGCSSEVRNFEVYNGCPMPVRIDAATTSGAAFTWAGLPTLPFDFQPMMTMPFVFSARASPTTTGLQGGALSFVVEGHTRVVRVTANGVERARETVTYRIDPIHPVSLVLAIDSSPSFVARRADVRDAFSTLFGLMPFANCADFSVSLVAADGEPDGGHRWLSTDAGQTLFKTVDGGLEALREAFDSMPVGSETESCVAPVNALVPSADAGLSVICITDADEHAPDFAQQLAALEARRRWVQWRTEGPFGSTCPVEALDAGVQREVLTLTRGSSADVCEPASWWGGWGGVGSCLRREFHLPAPVDLTAPLVITMNGQPTPPVDAQGNLVWSFDDAVVTFTTPVSGSEVVFEYLPACR